ncbi:hypothetical protein GmHk_11G032418 [Glycine max]|nr:hypothetical protein GmHk_11G032418 [Glycine max]
MMSLISLLHQKTYLLLFSKLSTHYHQHRTMTHTTKPQIMTPTHHHDTSYSIVSHCHRALVHMHKHGVATRSHHLHPTSNLVHHHCTVASFLPRDHHSLQHHNIHPDQARHQPSSLNRTRTRASPGTCEPCKTSLRTCT